MRYNSRVRVSMVVAVVGLLALHSGTASAVTVRPDRTLFDFESGTYAGWAVEGGAFGEKPFHASAVAPTWRADRRPHGWQGEFMVITGGMRHAVQPPGRLLSDPFVIDRAYLKFLLGGEVRPDVRVVLEVGGKEVRTAYGNNSYDLRLRGWDVSDLAGRTARIVIQDTAADQSLIRVDYFHLSDEPPPPIENWKELRPQESDLLRYGEFKPILPYAGPGYLRHHALVYGHDGRWHLWASVYENGSERRLVHATSAQLGGPFEIVQTEAFVPDPERGEQFVRDPHVVAAHGRYYLFYVGSGKTWQGFEHRTQGPYNIHLAISTDGSTWKRHANNPVISDQPFAFTPYVHPIEHEWVIYYAGTEPANMATGVHSIVHRRSGNLVDWSDRAPVFLRDAKIAWAEHSFVHSPVVFRRGDIWYLLTGPLGNMNQARYHYRQVFVSKTPFHWDSPVFKERSPYKGLFLEGGAHVLRDKDGTWHVTHSGRWAGGVWLAPLSFNDGLDEADTSVAVPGGAASTDANTP